MTQSSLLVLWFSHSLPIREILTWGIQTWPFYSSAYSSFSASNSASVSGHFPWAILLLPLPGQRLPQRAQEDRSSRKETLLSVTSLKVPIVWPDYKILLLLEDLLSWAEVLFPFSDHFLGPPVLLLAFWEFTSNVFMSQICLENCETPVVLHYKTN